MQSLDSSVQVGVSEQFSRSQRVALWISRRWLALAIVGFFIFNIGAWVAPILMQAGHTEAADAVYTAYSPFCHQMAQRSFFLFGDQVMYTPEDFPMQASGNVGADTLIMRHFHGSEELGWKVAWSDRMVYMYGATLIAMLGYAWVSRRRTVQPISIGVLALLLLPMALDGTSHFISDIDGLFKGFRYENAWLHTLTGGILPDSFYQGDQIGSFNSWMRLLSGITFGIGVIWFTFPYLDQAMKNLAETLAPRRE